MKETRTCKGCSKSMKLHYFANAGKLDKSGKPYKRHYCSKYGCYWNRKKHSPSGRMAKAQKIKEYKETCSCVNCGYSKNTRGKWFTTWVLQFHHHDSDKEANVSDMISNGYSLKNIFKEIKKCIVLCSNCHMELHGRKNY